MPAPLRWVTVWAAVILFAIGSVWYSQVQADRDTCERSNEFRREDLPRAFEAYSYFLGDELGADRQQAADAYARFRPTLDELFPERQC